MGGRFLVALLMLGSAWPATAWCQETDVVTIRTGRDGNGQRQLQGEILDYTGLLTTVREENGRRSEVDSKLVLRIQTSRTTEHLEANRQFSERRYGQALDLYRRAMREEQRRWMQRELLARIVWCYANQSKTVEAGDTFRVLVQDDPTTPHFPCIPLNWKPLEPTLQLEQRAADWLKDERPALRLIGASWLLSSRQRREAKAALQQLSNDKDVRIAYLADAQQWRTQLLGAKARDFERWQEQLSRMPRTLRAGPYFVLGRALALQGRKQDAALLLLRPPILYSDNYVLSADALLAAAHELDKLDKSQQAAGLYQEIVRDYPASVAAREARHRLKTPSKAPTN